MKGPPKLVGQACSGARPERTPIFGLFRNDAVIEHFGGAVSGGTDDLAVAKLAAAGIDGINPIEKAARMDIFAFHEKAMRGLPS
jgi:hypothetical protein